MNNNHQKIRKLLLASPDGLTLDQLAYKLGKRKTTLRSSINRMPDVYIDRYEDTSIIDEETGEKRGGTPWSPVYMAVEVPADAPMPRSPRKD